MMALFEFIVSYQTDLILYIQTEIILDEMSVLTGREKFYTKRLSIPKLIISCQEMNADSDMKTIAS